MIDNLRIIYSMDAVEVTSERLFPQSKNRSPRTRKKLIKRHGGEFRKRPCIYRAGDRIIAHPAMRAEIERAFR